MQCNKMTCPTCRTLSCYVCRAVITGYEHFDQVRSSPVHIRYYSLAASSLPSCRLPVAALRRPARVRENVVSGTTLRSAMSTKSAPPLRRRRRRTNAHIRTPTMQRSRSRYPWPPHPPRRAPAVACGPGLGGCSGGRSRPSRPYPCSQRTPCTTCFPFCAHFSNLCPWATCRTLQCGGLARRRRRRRRHGLDTLSYPETPLT